MAPFVVIVNTVITTLSLLLVCTEVCANVEVHRLFSELGLVSQRVHDYSGTREDTAAFSDSIKVTKALLNEIADKSPADITPTLLINVLLYFIINPEERHFYLNSHELPQVSRQSLLQKMGVRYSVGGDESQTPTFLGESTTNIDLSNLMKYAWLHQSTFLDDDEKITRITLKCAVPIDDIEHTVNTSLGDIIPVTEQEHSLTAIARYYPVLLDFLAAAYMANPAFSIYERLHFISVRLKSDVFHANFDLPSDEEAAQGFFQYTPSSFTRITTYFWGIMGQQCAYTYGASSVSKNSLPQLIWRQAGEFLDVMAEVFNLTNSTHPSRKFILSGSAELLILQCLHNFHQSAPALTESVQSILNYPLVFDLKTLENIQAKNSLVFFLNNQAGLRLDYYLAGPNHQKAAIKSYIKELTKNSVLSRDAAQVNEVHHNKSTALIIIYNNTLSTEDLADALKQKHWITPDDLAIHLQTPIPGLPIVNLTDLLQHIPGYHTPYRPEDKVLVSHTQVEACIQDTHESINFTTLLKKHNARIASFLMYDSLRFQASYNNSILDPKFKSFVGPERVNDHTIIMLPDDLMTTLASWIPEPSQGWATEQLKEFNAKPSKVCALFRNLLEVSPISPFHGNKAQKNDLVFLNSNEVAGFQLPVENNDTLHVKMHEHDGHWWEGAAYRERAMGRSAQGIYLKPATKPIESSEKSTRLFKSELIHNELPLSKKGLENDGSLKPKHSDQNTTSIAVNALPLEVSKKTDGFKGLMPDALTPGNSASLLSSLRTYKEQPFTVLFTRHQTLFPYGQTLAASEQSFLSHAKTIREGGNGWIYKKQFNGKPFIVKKTLLRTAEYLLADQLDHNHLVTPIAAITGEVLSGRRYVYYIYPEFTKDLGHALGNMSKNNYGQLRTRFQDDPLLLERVDRNVTHTLASILSAMVFYHNKERPLVHRDIKPSNVFVKPLCSSDKPCPTPFSCVCRVPPYIALGDYDATKKMDEMGYIPCSSNTEYGKFYHVSPVGTQGYKAPEQTMYLCTDRQELLHDVTTKADIYSFGAMVGELFVGQKNASGHSGCSLYHYAPMLHAQNTRPLNLPSDKSDVEELTKRFQRLLQDNPAGSTEITVEQLRKHAENIHQGFRDCLLNPVTQPTQKPSRKCRARTASDDITRVLMQEYFPNAPGILHFYESTVQPCPEDRPTAEQLLSHPFITSKGEDKTTIPDWGQPYK